MDKIGFWAILWFLLMFLGFMVGIVVQKTTGWDQDYVLFTIAGVITLVMLLGLWQDVRKNGWQP